MELLIQGSGASDGVPAMFAPSRVSDYARQHGGKDMRTRAAALIDQQLRIDFGPETWTQFMRDGLRLTDLMAVVFTHSHDDHFAPAELQYCLYPFTNEFECSFSLYGNEQIISDLHHRYEDWPFDLHVIRSFQPFQLAEYVVTPIAAYHKLDEDSLNLIVEGNGSTMLYATDTGYWRPPTWEFINGWQFDAVVIECTEGLHRTAYHGHLDLKECVEMVQRMREIGCIRKDTHVITTHHSALGDLTHVELEDALKPYNIQPGYDGMQICF